MDWFKYNDGGRADAGYKGHTGDCVARSIAIASGRPYKEIYDALANGNASQKIGKHAKRKANDAWAAKGLPFSGKEYRAFIKAKTKPKTAAQGINTNRKWFKDYMKQLGFEWVPCMGIGTGCKVHLKWDELPHGNLVCALSGHYTAVIDLVLNDIYDCSRGGTRCVYGYYKLIKNNSTK